MYTASSLGTGKHSSFAGDCRTAGATTVHAAAPLGAAPPDRGWRWTVEFGEAPPAAGDATRPLTPTRADRRPGLGNFKLGEAHTTSTVQACRAARAPKNTAEEAPCRSGWTPARVSMDLGTSTDRTEDDRLFKPRASRPAARQLKLICGARATASLRWRRHPPRRRCKLRTSC